MWKQYGVIVAMIWGMCALPIGTTGLAEDWELINDFDETFLVFVRSSSQRRYSFRRYEIPANRSARIKLGDDLHDLQVRPKGGGLVILEPLELIDRPQTNLSEVVSPQGRKNGRQLYEAMQNDGYEIDEEYLDLITAL